MSIGFRKVCLLALLILLPPAFASRAHAAQDWKPLPASQSGERVLYNPASVLQLAADLYRVEVKVLRPDGSQLDLQQELNCSFKTFRTLRSVEKKAGQPDRVTFKPSDVHAAENDPAADELYKTFCRGVPRKGN